MIVFRGDMVHKTERFQRARVAWSVRVVNSADTVSVSRLTTLGLRKLITIVNNIGSYTSRISTIRAMGLWEMSYGNLKETRPCAMGDMEKCPLSTFERAAAAALQPMYHAYYNTLLTSYTHLEPFLVDYLR